MIIEDLGRVSVDKLGKSFFVGFDVGSSFVHYTVLSGDREIVYSPKSIMHFANPVGGIKEAWKDILTTFGADKIKSTAFTGSGAEAFPKVMEDVSYVFDSVAIPKGIEGANPNARYVFHVGAKDAYFFELKQIGGKKVIQEWRTGTKCGGGSGTLIEKQCRRLFEGEVPNPKLADPATASNPDEKEDIRIRNRAKLQSRLEEMYRRAEEEALKAEEPSEFLARCGVVIQSDLIHKQNEGATRPDNLSGLFRTVARNYKIDVLGARTIDGDEGECEAIVSGGIFANDLIRKSMEEFLDLGIERANHFENIAAIGAAMKAIEEDNDFVFDIEQLDQVAAYSREKRKYTPSLSLSLEKVNNQSKRLAPRIKQGTEVVLGIDGGSTTTKGALVDLKTGRLLDKLYIKTHGNPEESLKRVLKHLGRHKSKVVVRGVGATGSARKLYEKILVRKKKAAQLADDGIELADRVTDEITCHALGVKHYDNDVDTIFEVGGQDMKFTSFAPDGSVKEAKMNYSCQAGSGQTLENMADIINLNVENTLQEAALRAEKVPIIDSTCGVFMEMDENRLIAEGFDKDEIAAAIVRGTAASYYYKFVGGSGHSGKKCSAQGGPPLGKAFLAALAQVSENEIEAFPHREMFGAWGQALDIIENIKRNEEQGKKCESAFRGWDLVNMPFDKRKVSCAELFDDKTCGMRDCQLEIFSIEDDEIITGGFCPRGNSETSKKPKPNYVDKYHKIYDRHFKKLGCLQKDLPTARKENQALKTVGIKRSTATLGEKGIWSAALLKKLGLFPVVSPRTTKEIAEIGVDNSRTEYCIARKLATGHAAVLNRDPNIDYLFNPSFIEQRTGTLPDLKYCIYTESEGYILNDVLSLDKSKQINPILHFGDEGLLIRQLKEEFDRLQFGFSAGQIKEAINFADNTEREFKEEIYAEGEKFLKKIEAGDTKAYVGVGRDYVLLDPEASSNSGNMFSQIRGLDYIPQQFIERQFENISLKGVVENEFWVQSVKILKASLFVADHPNLFAIRMMNFACGPDSLKVYQEEKIQQAAGKPLLVLVTDAQTNNAPFVTRTEAHERVVEQSKHHKLKIDELKRRSREGSEERTWLIPYMGDASCVGAAGLRYFGVDSIVLPTDTERGYEAARRHIYTEVCHPLKGVVGDAIGFLEEKIEEEGADYVKKHYLVMMPTTSGPCRFGKYTELVRGFLDKEGLQDVPVAGPSSETDYLDIPFPRKLSASDTMRMQRMLFKGIKGSDLLEDIFLRFHPYAEDKKAMAELRQQQLRELEKVVEAGAETPALVEWGKKTVYLFKSCKLRDQERYPLVLYIGEIYMRMHDPATDFVVRKLEERGLEVVRDPVTDWLDYVNKMNVRNSKRDLGLRLKSFDFSSAKQVAGKFGKSILKSKYMSSVENKIAAPFHEVLHGRHVLPKPIEIINTLEKHHEYHGNIEGESPLSSGIAYHIMNDLVKPHGDTYISGIFHVGPFTCMQEGVATAKMEAMAKELRKRKPDLVFPIIHAFFGDSASANLDSEIAVFAEQCYQKRDMLMEKQAGQIPPKETSGPIDIKDIPKPERSAETLTEIKR